MVYTSRHRQPGDILRGVPVAHLPPGGCENPHDGTMSMADNPGIDPDRGIKTGGACMDRQRTGICRESARGRHRISIKIMRYDTSSSETDAIPALPIHGYGLQSVTSPVPGEPPFHGRSGTAPGRGRPCGVNGNDRILPCHGTAAGWRCRAGRAGVSASRFS